MSSGALLCLLVVWSVLPDSTVGQGAVGFSGSSESKSAGTTSTTSTTGSGNGDVVFSRSRNIGGVFQGSISAEATPGASASAASTGTIRTESGEGSISLSTDTDGSIITDPAGDKEEIGNAGTIELGFEETGDEEASPDEADDEIPQETPQVAAQEAPTPSGGTVTQGFSEATAMQSSTQGFSEATATQSSTQGFSEATVTQSSTQGTGGSATSKTIQVSVPAPAPVDAVQDTQQQQQPIPAPAPMPMPVAPVDPPAATVPQASQDPPASSVQEDQPMAAAAPVPQASQVPSASSVQENQPMAAAAPVPQASQVPSASSVQENQPMAAAAPVPQATPAPIPASAQEDLMSKFGIDMNNIRECRGAADWKCCDVQDFVGRDGETFCGCTNTFAIRGFDSGFCRWARIHDNPAIWKETRDSVPDTFKFCRCSNSGYKPCDGLTRRECCDSYMGLDECQCNGDLCNFKKVQENPLVWEDQFIAEGRRCKCDF